MQATSEMTLTKRSPATTRPVTLGVIVGNRDFFPDRPDHRGARRDRGSLRRPGTRRRDRRRADDEARGDRDLRRRDEVRGALPGPRRAHRRRARGAAQLRRREGGRRHPARERPAACPILVQAVPDDLGRLDVARRRDSFCGKISVCNNLRQYGYPFSASRAATPWTSPTPSSAGTSVVRRGLPGGARPAAGAAGRDRRPPSRLQHRPLQREAARAQRGSA